VFESEWVFRARAFVGHGVAGKLSHGCCWLLGVC
jgi:hypothetical protein